MTSYLPTLFLVFWGTSITVLHCGCISFHSHHSVGEFKTEDFLKENLSISLTKNVRKSPDVKIKILHLLLHQSSAEVILGNLSWPVSSTPGRQSGRTLSCPHFLTLVPLSLSHTHPRTWTGWGSSGAPGQCVLSWTSTLGQEGSQMRCVSLLLWSLSTAPGHHQDFLGAGMFCGPLTRVKCCSCILGLTLMTAVGAQIWSTAIISLDTVLVWFLLSPLIPPWEDWCCF